MTSSNVGASQPLEEKVRTEAAAFAARIPVEMAARAADIYDRAVRASADLLGALIDRDLMAREVQELYRPDRPAGVEGGDWLVAIEDHIGLGAALNVMIHAAGCVGLGTACCAEVKASTELDWPDTAWPLSLPRPGLDN